MFIVIVERKEVILFDISLDNIETVLSIIKIKVMKIVMVIKNHNFLIKYVEENV